MKETKKMIGIIDYRARNLSHIILRKLHLKSEHWIHATNVWRLPKPSKDKIRTISVRVREEQDHSTRQVVKDHLSSLPAKKQKG